MSVPRLALLCDYPEEGWPSMDLCAEMLLAHLCSEWTGRVRATRFCPPFRRRLAGLPLGRAPRWGLNADRLLNRVWDYPRHLRRHAKRFDLFHVCDHSYAHLARVLPGDRTGVFCHDLEAFHCLLAPRGEPRPRWFRGVMRRVLEGLQKAAVVFYSTAAVRAEIERHGLLPPDRLIHAPYGTAPEFRPEPARVDREGVGVPGVSGRAFLLHVGSCIRRKRIEVLLEVFARVRARHPGLTLVQVGGRWTGDQQAQIRRLGITGSLRQVRGLDRQALAALYRRALLVLLPSEVEGFGLPVLEALACGSVVVASDIPVLREVGGPGAVYCPVADVAVWADAICRLIEHPTTAPDRFVRLGHVRRYSWAAQAQTIVTAYERLLPQP
jgi:glycosyltransferase involved in cell wall biosynthesis